MIPEEFKHEVISTGIEFMRSITNAYGADEGMKLWDAIADSMDPDLKGQIFFALMTGGYSGSITIVGVDPALYQETALMTSPKIAAIKAMRHWSIGVLGLKDAKEGIEDAEAGKPYILKVDAADRAKAVQELRAIGCICR
jgi:hypothetical protein